MILINNFVNAVTKNTLAVVAVVLVLNHYIFFAYADRIASLPIDIIWLIINIIEFTVLFLSFRALRTYDKSSSLLIGAISGVLFVITLLDQFIVNIKLFGWIVVSTLVLFGLMLSAILLFKKTQSRILSSVK